MQVKSSGGLLSKMLGKYGAEIIVYSEATESLKRQLSKVDLILYDEPYYEGNFVYIFPVRTRKSISYKLYDQELAKMRNTESFDKIVEIQDFKSSKEFYDIFSGKSKHKILSDEHSYARASDLYEFASKVETKLRLEYVKQYSENISLPKNYNSKLRDHIIGQFETFELFTDLLHSDSSDDFYLSRIKNAVNDKEKIIARKLNKLDELNFEITREEFDRFCKVRNAIMHFRVITTEDSVEFLKFVNKFDLQARKKEFLNLVFSIASGEANFSS